MELNNKHLLFTVSAMGLGHVHRSLPIIRYLLGAGSRLTILSHGRALETIQMELVEYPGIEYLEFEDYPPIQRGRGIAYYGFLIKDLLETGIRIRKERKFLETLLTERHFDLLISDGRFGFTNACLPSFLICHQIRFFLPRWLRLFQPLSDLVQYLLLRNFTKIIVPDFSDSDINLAGKLSHNWVSRKLDPIYIGFLSSTKRVRVSEAIDILFITGGFIEDERKIIIEWAQQHLINLGQKVVFALGAAGSNVESTGTNGAFVTYSSVHGQKRNELLCSAHILVGRTGYTTIMDICELGLRAALTPTPGMTEQEYLANYIAYWNHRLLVEIPLEKELTWVSVDGNALPPSIRQWSTEKSLERLADFLTGFVHH